MDDPLTVGFRPAFRLYVVRSWPRGMTLHEQSRCGPSGAASGDGGAQWMTGEPVSSITGSRPLPSLSTSYCSQPSAEYS